MMGRQNQTKRTERERLANRFAFSITRTTQTLYQTAAIRKLIITGTGLTQGSTLVFDPPLTKDVDYSQRFVDSNKLILTLNKGKRWAPYECVLAIKTVKSGSKNIPIGSGGEGVQVATIKADPTVEESKRIIFNSHTKRLFIKGSGFSIDGTEITLTPTSRAAYEIESIEYDQIVLRLVDGKSWTPEGKGAIMATKFDTGAGEVILTSEVQVANVEPDDKDNNCDDSCEWALDGVCDDGTGSGSAPWFDDDYGGLYAYGKYDDFYGYGYGADDYLGPVCDPGTDCSDCGGPPTPDAPPVCDNSCQWSNDGFCDDTRTTGLCNAGTDCHDCGPVGASNFTSQDDDGWWDDDDNYWEMDDVLDAENKGNPKVARGIFGRGNDGDEKTGKVLEGFGYTFVGFVAAFCTYSTIQHFRTPVDLRGKYTKVPVDPNAEDLDKIG